MGALLLRRRALGATGLPPITDSFNRANALTLGSTDTGQTWLYSATNWQIESNRARIQLGGSTSYAHVQSLRSDCTVSVLVPVPDSTGGEIIFRYQDASNRLRATFDLTNCTVRRVVAGTSTTILTVAHGGLVAATPIKVKMAGSLLEFYNGATLVGSVTETAHQTQTKHGLFTSNSAVRFDDFSVT